MGTWIRRDQSDGTLSEVPESEVISRAKLGFRNWREAMSAASEKMPLCNAFACYWPKPDDDGAYSALLASVVDECHAIQPNPKS